MIEKIYSLLVNKRKILYEFTLTYVLATVSGIISDVDYESAYQLLSKFIPHSNIAIWFMYILIVISVFVAIAYRIISSYIKTKSIPHQLSKIMALNTENYFENIGFQSGYSWGSDRTWLVCNNIFEGWDPKNIFIDMVDNDPFKFTSSLSYLNNYYDKFLLTRTAQQIISRHNNNVRLMITNITQNFNPHEKQIYIQLKKTNWCMNQFTWKYLRENPDFKAQKIRDLYNGIGNLLPNSFCLHLILTTSDKKIILTRVSSNKRNDYPSTWAATIGEQIEYTDVTNEVNYAQDFVYRWTKRAISEEFGIEGEMYKTIVSKDSLRVLSFDVEGDIYNISMVAVLNLNYSFNEFEEYTKNLPTLDREISEMKAIDFEDIPQILLDYQNNKYLYHPSTYLRLYLCYIHYFGINRFLKSYKDEEKKLRNI